MMPSRAGAGLDPEDEGTRSLEQIELVIFDFDGVVADSEIISLSTLQNALGKHGVEMSRDEVMRTFLGRSLRTIVDVVTERAPRASMDGFAETWHRELFAEFRRSLKPVPSVLALLDHLDSHRVRYCVASSSSHERLGVALEAMRLTERLRHLFSAEDVNRGKPFPDLFLHAAEGMGAVPETCLVIEDSPFGAQAARRANMRCAGFVGGSHLSGVAADHAKQLVEHGADLVVSSHETLILKGLGVGRSETP